MPLLSQPSAALLTNSQKGTHAVRPLSRVIRGPMTTSLSEAVVLSTDVVAEGEVKECILRQPGPLPDNVHAPTYNHASSFTGAATLDGIRLR